MSKTRPNRKARKAAARTNVGGHVTKQPSGIVVDSSGSARVGSASVL